VVAELHALVADEHRRAGDELADFVLALAAEGAIQELAVVVFAAGIVGHALPSKAKANQSLLYILQSPWRRPGVLRNRVTVATLLRPGYIARAAVRLQRRPCRPFCRFIPR